MLKLCERKWENFKTRILSRPAAARSRQLRHLNQQGLKSDLRMAVPADLFELRIRRASDLPESQSTFAFGANFLAYRSYGIASEKSAARANGK